MPVYDHLKFLMLYSFIFFAGNNAVSGFFGLFWVFFIFIQNQPEGIRFSNFPILYTVYGQEIARFGFLFPFVCVGLQNQVKYFFTTG